MLSLPLRISRSAIAPLFMGSQRPTYLALCNYNTQAVAYADSISSIITSPPPTTPIPSPSSSPSPSPSPSPSSSLLTSSLATPSTLTPPSSSTMSTVIHNEPRLPSIDEVMAEINEFRHLRPTNVSLQQMMNFGKHVTPTTLIHAANFLHKELPIRLARQLGRLERLAYGMCIMPSIVQLRSWYVESFRELRAISSPIRTADDQNRFTSVLSRLFQRHSTMHFMIARGLNELRSELNKNYRTVGMGMGLVNPMAAAAISQSADVIVGDASGTQVDLSNYSDLHEQLDQFYLSRIGIRTLVSHHLELQNETRRLPNHVGIICLETSPADVAADAIANASYVCNRTYGRAPTVALHAKQLHFPFVPSHLYYMLFELLKNSMRATVEFHRNDATLPPIRIVVADGEMNEDCAIKVSDEGGGVPRSMVPRIWSYLYSTTPLDFRSFESFADFANESPLAGLGVGLPISRLYARYFRGDLQLISMEGYGTDAYIHLNRLGNLPEPSIRGHVPDKRT